MSTGNKRWRVLEMVTCKWAWRHRGRRRGWLFYRRRGSVRTQIGACLPRRSRRAYRPVTRRRQQSGPLLLINGGDVDEESLWSNDEEWVSEWWRVRAGTSFRRAVYIAISLFGLLAGFDESLESAMPRCGVWGMFGNQDHLLLLFHGNLNIFLLD